MLRINLGVEICGNFVAICDQMLVLPEIAQFVKHCCRIQIFVCTKSKVKVAIFNPILDRGEGSLMTPK